MIRDAILHLLNEQPLIVDLPALPAAGDTCVVCSNLRMTSGRPPVWVDRGEDTFVFPLGQVRFLEVPAVAADAAPSGETAVVDRAPDEAELELDEDLLRRIRET